MFEINLSNAIDGIYANDFFHVKYYVKKEDINYIGTTQAVADNFGFNVPHS